MKGRKAWAFFGPIGVILVALLLDACTAWVPPRPSELPDLNVLPNPFFLGADQQIPPPGWNVYSGVDEFRRISLINADDPENRALLIEDLTMETTAAGETGITADVPGVPGKTYMAEVTYKGLPDQPQGTVGLQIRFLPSGEYVYRTIRPVNTDDWETITFEGVAPEGTTTVRVYVYTWKAEMTVIALKSFRLLQLD